MFKKIVTVTLVLVLSLITLLLTTNVYGYQQFEHLEIVGRGKMLDQFSEKDFKDNYKKVGRKFMGYNKVEVNKRVNVKFVSDTLLSYYNNGFSPIKYNYSASRKVLNTYDLKVTGQLSIKTQKNNKIFGDGLNASIKIDTGLKNSTEIKEDFNLSLEIAPKSQLNLYLYGEGYLVNGVAKKYFFWFETKKGGYEIFYLTTHYQRMEITRLWERL